MEHDSQHDETTILDRKTATKYVVRIPCSDIGRCLRTPPWLAVLTAVGLLLAATDMPRTGSTYFANDHRGVVRPGVTMYWGPYAYHVGHLRLTPNSSTTEHGQPLVDGVRDGEKLSSLETWSYKYDTLSIGPRAIVGHLNVTSYPPCVVYREPCKSSTLGLATVFTMLDGLAQSVQDRLFKEPSMERQPFSFTTWSNWVDRLHHRVYLAFGRNPDRRSHDLYHLSSRHDSHLGKRAAITPLIICGDRHTRSFPVPAKPKFCDDPIVWRCTDPINPTSDSPVPVWDHIAIRFDDLQRRYPGLDLDLTMFITTLKEKSWSHWHLLPSVSFVTDSLEITTLIRGRHCTTPDQCRTGFVDDYRYERATIESDENEWTHYVFTLRWLSQLYVWIRIGSLCTGCYLARSRERKHCRDSMSSKLINTGTTLLRIPANIIVYGSWIPLIGYSLAHFIDSGLVQTIGEFAWTSVGGFYTFKPIDYAMTASIQMRNIWIIAFVWKLSFMLRDVLPATRSGPLNSESDGFVVLRGGWIGVISWLTTLGLMRAIHFRDTKIVRFLAFPRHTATSVAHVDRNFSDYGVHFDIKCAFAALVVVYCGGWLIQRVVRLATGQESSYFFSRTLYVPLSAGTIWSKSQLDTFWLVRFRPHSNGPRVLVSHRPSHTTRSPSPSPSIVPLGNWSQPKTPPCRVCGFQPSMIHWRSTQGCRLHEPILDVHRRTEALWSMVRLMNIANMTEPVVLFRLYVTGMPLYLYRVHSNQVPYSILLPTRMERNGDASSTPTATMQWAKSRADIVRDSDAAFELLQVVNSRDVPWHVLVNCG